MVREKKVLLAEPEGGDLHAEDRELRVLRHQAKPCPHFVPAADPYHILFSAKASLEEILSEEQ